MGVLCGVENINVSGKGRMIGGREGRNSINTHGVIHRTASRNVHECDSPLLLSRNKGENNGDPLLWICHVAIRRAITAWHLF
jgi:hypothetical protein